MQDEQNTDTTTMPAAAGVEPLELAEPVDLVEVDGPPDGDRSIFLADEVDPGDPDFDHSDTEDDPEPEGGDA